MRMVFKMLLNLLKVNLKSIEDLDAEYIRRRAEMMDYSKVIVNSAGKNLPQDVIDFVYWESGLPSDLLPKALGISSSAMRNKVTVYRLVIPCSKCGEGTIHSVRSKAQLTEKKSFAKSNPILCDECVTIEMEKARAREQRKSERQKVKRQNRIAELQDMPYDDYLQTDHWEKVRKSALVKADYRCTKCRRRNVPLDVHHLTYAHRGYEYPDDLRVLCRPCHEHIHGKKFMNSNEKVKPNA